jgi:hypothetical protein
MEMLKWFFLLIKLKYLPLQINPLPSKPVLQRQMYDPGLFVQFAKLWHGPLGHSLISTKKKKLTNEKYEREKIQITVIEKFKVFSNHFLISSCKSCLVS